MPRASDALSRAEAPEAGSFAQACKPRARARTSRCTAIAAGCYGKLRVTHARGRGAEARLRGSLSHLSPHRRRAATSQRSCLGMPTHRFMSYEHKQHNAGNVTVANSHQARELLDSADPSCTNDWCFLNRNWRARQAVRCTAQGGMTRVRRSQTASYAAVSRKCLTVAYPTTAAAAATLPSKE